MMGNKMSVEETRQVLESYFNSDHDDTSMMADDVVFEDMLSGQKFEGPQAVQGMLDYVYRQAFDARAEVHNVTYGEGSAVLEATFHGTQKTEFGGIPNTGATISAPLAVCYDCADGKLVRARIYSMVGPTLMQQQSDADTAA